MLVLAIDTSTQAGGVAALDGDRCLGNVFERSERPFSSRLFQNLDLLLDRLACRISDFDLLAVGAGPGSFTGLRVGLTAVKAWAELYDQPIAAVSGLHAIAAQSHAEVELVAAVLDARRGQVFGGIYRHGAEGLQLASAEMVASAEEFVAAVERQVGSVRIAFATPTPELLSGALSKSVLGSAPLELVSADLAPWIGRIGYELAVSGDVADAISLDANYVRRSDAELYWKPA